MIGVILKLRIRPGTNVEFERRLAQFKQAVDENEDGNLYYDIYQGSTDVEYIVLEKFKDQQALQDHDQTWHKQHITPLVGEYLDAKPEVQILYPPSRED